LIGDLVDAGHDVFAHGWRHISYARESESILHR